MANVNLQTSDLASKYSIVNEDGSYFMVCITYFSYVKGNYATSQFGLMANLLVCNGTPCQVLVADHFISISQTIHVKASVRTGKLNFVTCLRKSLEEHFKGIHLLCSPYLYR